MQVWAKTNNVNGFFKRQNAMSIIDFRSDTVTKPTPAMRQALAAADVGDDGYGEDPTVNRLQERIAHLLGKEAALFVPSGTMANQLAIRCQTQPGDEIICEAASHFLDYEVGGAAALSGVSTRPLPGDAGVITAAQVQEAIRPATFYFPRTRLIVLENTHNLAGGVIWPLARIQEISALAKGHGLRMHLDGARLWNASVASGVAPRTYAAFFDSVSVCFSKGLGAPAGSALAGTKEFIETARRFRKMFGGGMRQCGILAAAAIYALEHHYERLREDHAHARMLAEELARLPSLLINLNSVQTNIIKITVADKQADCLAAIAALKDEGVWVTPMGSSSFRVVTHLGITAGDIARAAEIFRKVFRQSSF